MVVHVRRIQPGVKCQRDAPVDADGRIEDAVQVTERHRTLGHLVDDKVQRVALQVEQHADGTAGGDSALDAPLVDRVVLEPGPLPVDVHREALIVLTCRDDKTNAHKLARQGSPGETNSRP